MTRYLRSVKVASTVELITAAVWIVPALALTVVSLVMAAQGPPPQPPGAPPPTTGFFFAAALLYLGMGAFGALPCLLVGFVLRHESRTASGGSLGPILAILFAFLFLGIISYFVLMAVTVGDNSAPIDIDFLVVGILIGLTGAVHLGAGVAVLWGLHALPRSARRDLPSTA